MPKITALPPAASVTSDDLIAIVNAPGGAAVTQYATLAQLRVALYAITSADPLTAGAASFTTGAFSSTLGVTGNLTVGASTFVVTAATGAVSAASLILGPGALPSGGKGSFLVASAIDEILNIGGLQATNTGGHFLRLLGGVAGATTRGYFGFAHTGSGGDSIWGGELADAVCLRGEAGLQLGSNVIALTIAPTTGAATFASSLAITGALTGVTTVNLTTQPAFVAGSKYLVIDASGNVQVSALGPLS